ncbi:MAG: ATP-dependent chaperone ClpB, partial [Phycisphaerales bacterium]|nr:ATP-dependent chaperone ClpB [Phycisphaerales bacterium]
MRMDRFTTLAQQTLSDAQALASSRSHAELQPLHVLVAMLNDTQGIARSIFEKAGVQPAPIMSVAEAELKRLPSVSGGDAAGMTPSRDFMQMMNVAEQESKALGDSYVSTEHILLALSESKSSAKEVLQVSGVRRDALMNAVKALRAASGVTNVNDANAEQSYEALKKYGIDLVEKAQQGKLDPVIGRDDEIRRCLQVLSRRTKNNPVLIG